MRLSRFPVHITVGQVAVLAWVAFVAALAFAVVSYRPPTNQVDRCLAVKVYYAEQGLLYQMGESKVCATEGGFVIEDIIWPNGIPEGK